MPQGALNFWEAFDAVEPIGEEWRQSAMIAHENARLQFAKAGRKPPEFDCFMPERYRPAPKDKLLPKPGEAKSAFQTMMSLFGFDKMKGISNGDND